MFVHTLHVQLYRRILQSDGFAHVRLKSTDSIRDSMSFATHQQHGLSLRMLYWVRMLMNLNIMDLTIL